MEANLNAMNVPFLKSTERIETEVLSISEQCNKDKIVSPSIILCEQHDKYNRSIIVHTMVHNRNANNRSSFPYF